MNKCPEGHVMLMSNIKAPYVCAVCMTRAADDINDAIVERLHEFDNSNMRATRVATLRMIEEEIRSRANAAESDFRSGA